MKGLKIKPKHDGVILILALFILSLLTIIALSGFSLNIVKNKMANNTLNHYLAFQAAESGLRTGERWLQSKIDYPFSVSVCNQPPCDVWSLDAISQSFLPMPITQWWAISNILTDQAWWERHGRRMAYEIEQFNGQRHVETFAFVKSQPVFIIEEQGYMPDDLSPQIRAKGKGVYYYRITARGTGGQVDVNQINPAQSYVQSIFAKRYV